MDLEVNSVVEEEIVSHFHGTTELFSCSSLFQLLIISFYAPHYQQLQYATAKIKSSTADKDMLFLF